MAQGKFEVWSISVFEGCYYEERCKLYQNLEDAYWYAFGRAIRTYVKESSPDKIREFGRPEIAYNRGSCKDVTYIQFVVKVNGLKKYTYEITNETVF